MAAVLLATLNYCLSCKKAKNKNRLFQQLQHALSVVLHIFAELQKKIYKNMKNNHMWAVIITACKNVEIAFKKISKLI